MGGKNMKYQFGNMGFRDWRVVYVRFLTLMAIMWVATACAIQPQVVRHSFEFDALSDSPDVEVLNYRYGNSKLPGVAPADWALARGQIGQGTGVSGPMLVGDYLYVKWRIKATGVVYEQTIDLRHRLPRNIENHKIYFVIKGDRLVIYLISPERIARGEHLNNLPAYNDRKYTVIYPDQPAN